MARPGPAPRLNPADAAIVVTAYLLGYSSTTIAPHFGISSGTVSNLVRRAGHETRRRGPNIGAADGLPPFAAWLAADGDLDAAIGTAGDTIRGRVSDESPEDLTGLGRWVVRGGVARWIPADGTPSHRGMRVAA